MLILYVSPSKKPSFCSMEEIFPKVKILAGMFNVNCTKFFRFGSGLTFMLTVSELVRP